jgi:magnesium transporter
LADVAADTPDRSELLMVDAAAHASLRVPTTGPDASAGEVRRSLVGAELDQADAVAVLREGVLVGLVPLERLLAAQEDAPIDGLLERDPPTLAPGTNREQAAHRMVEHGVSTIAVLDGEGRFAGLIPAERMLAVMVEEHSEDLARIGGFLHGTQDARRAAEEQVVRRIWHRLPWLLIGLVGAMASVSLVAAFDAQLEEKVLLAFFLPALIYMAGAVGAQTQALVIRGMATGARWGSAIRRELLSGLAIGALIGLAFVPFVLIGWGDSDVALAVGLSLVLACSMSTAIALALPFLLRAFGLDPAFGSGPMATVLQDLGTIAVYMGICVLVVF